MEQIIDILATLGRRLAYFGKDDASRAIISRAIEQNEWFTDDDILQAICAIRREMLDEEKLRRWLSNYRPATEPKDVAVVMAGNIPLVGFFDLVCVLASGHRCHIKPSSKDAVLMEFIVGELKQINSQIPIFTYNPAREYDMAIATGGDSANRYFREHFASTRALLRGSRHSVAILDGTESVEELSALMRDITAYSGLGCRSVSMIFTPTGHLPELPYCEARNRKLHRNIASMRALYTIQQRDYQDYGACLGIYGERFSESLAIVTLRNYNDIADVKTWLEDNCDHIQCVVSHIPAIECAVPFGEAQYPTLWNYADGIDTMKFLTSED